MKRRIIPLLIALALVTLSGCGSQTAALPDESKPGRLVVRLDVVVYANEELERHYTDQAQISEILTLLRDLDTTEFPKEDPSVREDKEYCTITATYANGGSQVYTLLEEQYLNYDEEPFCIVDNTKAAALTTYFEDTPAK